METYSPAFLAYDLLVVELGLLTSGEEVPDILRLSGPSRSILSVALLSLGGPRGCSSHRSLRELGVGLLRRSLALLGLLAGCGVFLADITGTTLVDISVRRDVRSRIYKRRLVLFSNVIIVLAPRCVIVAWLRVRVIMGASAGRTAATVTPVISISDS